MATTPPTARRQRRRMVVAALQDELTLLGQPVPVSSPGAWNVPPEKPAQVMVRCGNDVKQGRSESSPQFLTTSVVEVQALVRSTNAIGAQDALEALCAQIEELVLTKACMARPDGTPNVQKVSSVVTTTEITVEAAAHVGSAVIRFGFDTTEAFEPTAELFPALERMDIRLDATQPADLTGTYANPAFPDSVQPAPREHGPDGRTEGRLVLDPRTL